MNIFKRMERKALIRFARYASVGVSTFLFDLLIVFVLVSILKVNYLLAVAVGFLIGISLNYAVSRAWVFRKTARKLSHGYLYFLIASSGSLTAIILLTGLLVEAAHLSVIPARVMVSGLVGMMNYLFNLYLNFKVAGKH